MDNLISKINVAQIAGPEIRKLEKASEGIEAMFVKDLMSAMRKSGIKTGEKQDFGGAIYKDMFDQALATTAGKRGTLGIASMLNKQFGKQVWAQAQKNAGKNL